MGRALMGCPAAAALRAKCVTLPRSSTEPALGSAAKVGWTPRWRVATEGLYAAVATRGGLGPRDFGRCTATGRSSCLVDCGACTWTLPASAAALVVSWFLPMVELSSRRLALLGGASCRRCHLGGRA